MTLQELHTMRTHMADGGEIYRQRMGLTHAEYSQLTNNWGSNTPVRSSRREYRGLANGQLNHRSASVLVVIL